MLTTEQHGRAKGQPTRRRHSREHTPRLRDGVHCQLEVAGKAQSGDIDDEQVVVGVRDDLPSCTILTFSDVVADEGLNLVGQRVLRHRLNLRQQGGHGNDPVLRQEGNIAAVLRPAAAGEGGSGLINALQLPHSRVFRIVTTVDRHLTTGRDSKQFVVDSDTGVGGPGSNRLQITTTAKTAAEVKRGCYTKHLFRRQIPPECAVLLDSPDAFLMDDHIDEVLRIDVFPRSGSCPVASSQCLITSGRVPEPIVNAIERDSMDPSGISKLGELPPRVITLDHEHIWNNGLRCRAFIDCCIINGKQLAAAVLVVPRHQGSYGPIEVRGVLTEPPT